jgi:hypothetical protein
LLLVRLKGVAAADEADTLGALREACQAMPGAAQVRIFVSSSPTRDHFALVGLHGLPTAPLDLAKSEKLGKHVDIVNVYAPYSPGG